MLDKSQRTDATFSRDDFSYHYATDTYRCRLGRPSSIIGGGSQYRGPA